MDYPELAATAFATLLVAFGPVETAAIFGGLTAGMERRDRLAVALRSVAIAGLVLFGFAFAGLPMLAALHISLDAFRVAGGILLLLQAIDLIFAQPTGLSALTPREEMEAIGRRDISVFPLAFPLIAGPATLTATVLLTAQAGGSSAGVWIVLTAMAACLAITYLSLVSTDLLSRMLRTTGTNVVARLSGIILAALAVQFIFDGVIGAQIFGPADR